MKDDHPMSLWEHLDELRKRLFVAAIVLIVTTGICFTYGYDLLMQLIRAPLDALDPNTVNSLAKYNPLVIAMRPYLMKGGGGAVELYQSTFMEAFVAKFKLSLVGGFVLGSPILFYQLWSFVGRGLKERERRFVLKYLPLSLLLFATGLAFGYFGAMPFALMYLLTVDASIKPLLMIGPYVGSMLLMLVMFGLAFELPLVTMALASLGIMSAKSLAKSRRYAIVIIFIVAAIITPSPEPFSQCLLAIPMVLLYEMGIWMARAAERRKEVTSSQ